MASPLGATLLAALAAAVLGAVPTGYLAGRWLGGMDVRRYSPHNLGLHGVLAAAGARTVALAAALDLAKGALAVLVASWLGVGGWGLVLAVAVLLVSHARSPQVFLPPPAGVRVKGVVAAAGALGALAAAGGIAGAAVVIPALVAAITLGFPRFAWGRWGFLSLATVLASATLPALLALTRAPVPYVAGALAYALVTLWNYKEHLARIADGTEPRVHERLPLPGRPGEDAVCAFLIHPMTAADFWQARRFGWLEPLYRRGVVTERTLRLLARHVRPMKVDDVHPIVTADGRRVRVYLIGVPLFPDQIQAEPDLAVRRAVEAAQLAANLGATVLGLGAYWSVVGNKGTDVQARSPIAITNGGAYTAGTVKMVVPFVLERLRLRGVDPAEVTAAVVGASGVVGFGICRAVAGHVRRLVMLGRHQDRLERSRELLARRHPGLQVDATTAYAALRDADVIFAATSEPTPVVYPEHVKPGALLIDLGRPPDVHPAVAAVEGVEVVAGGVVRLPGTPGGQLDFGYGPGKVPACLAETVIIGLERAYDRVSLGDRTRTEEIEYFVARGAALGFEVLAGAPPVSEPRGNRRTTSRTPGGG
ncbi:MAG: glycerol-3-phosphate acyltransferase [Armatimonadota bacterium]|nr:glycerol-3-phosphate acyltransferase [Armatimonadota bacterium]